MKGCIAPEAFGGFKYWVRNVGFLQYGSLDGWVLGWFGIECVGGDTIRARVYGRTPSAPGAVLVGRTGSGTWTSWWTTATRSCSSASTNSGSAPRKAPPPNKMLGQSRGGFGLPDENSLFSDHLGYPGAPNQLLTQGGLFL